MRARHRRSPARCRDAPVPKGGLTCGQNCGEICDLGLGKGGFLESCSTLLYTCTLKRVEDLEHVSDTVALAQTLTSTLTSSQAFSECTTYLYGVRSTEYIVGFMSEQMLLSSLRTPCMIGVLVVVWLVPVLVVVWLLLRTYLYLLRSSVR